MRFDIMTLFPELVERVLSESVIGRAQKSGAIKVKCHNIRDYSLDKHRRVDDTPYGGGKGMLMMAPPIYNCYEAICQEISEDFCDRQISKKVVYMSPRGKVFDQKKARELSELDELIILCGHYEGVDQRIIDKIVDEEISIGDYVLTGGELPAMVLIDTVSRMIDGVLKTEERFTLESHYNGLLEHPQYTRPPEFMGEKVPDVLLSGDHKKIEEWRKEMSYKETLEKRPDLLDK